MTLRLKNTEQLGLYCDALALFRVCKSHLEPRCTLERANGALREHR